MTLRLCPLSLAAVSRVGGLLVCLRVDFYHRLKFKIPVPGSPGCPAKHVMSR